MIREIDIKGVCSYLNESDILKQSEIVGIGTGRTISRLISCIDLALLRTKTVVPSSLETSLLLKNRGVRTYSPLSVDELDVYIDSADYATRDLNLIKGGGGALTTEKILASSSKKVIIAVTEEKLVKSLLDYPIPIEVIPQSISLVIRKLSKLGMEVMIREPARGKRPPVISDIGGAILDVLARGWPGGLKDLELTIKGTPGVIETGLFVNMTDMLIVVTSAETQIYTRQSR